MTRDPDTALTLVLLAAAAWLIVAKRWRVARRPAIVVRVRYSDATVRERFPAIHQRRRGPWPTSPRA